MSEFGSPTPTPAKPGVGETLSAAAALMRDHPRETMLPFLAIHAPIVVGTILATIVLYGTVFADEVYPRGGLTGALDEPEGAQFFVGLVILLVGAIFSLVAQGATIVSVTAIAEGRSLSLAEALDPAFTRLGGLIAITIVFVVVAGLLAITIVGLLALPYLIGRLGVTYQVYLLEKTDPLAAISRSWQVMGGNILRLLGVLIVTFVLIVVVGLLAPASPGPGSLTREGRMAIDAALQILQGGIAVPLGVFAHAAVTLYYLRIREDAS